MKTPKLKSAEFAITMAEGFYHTGQNLARRATTDNSTGYVWIAPGVVNFSFATELLLKGLLMIDSNVSTKGHKLLDLYKKIRITTRQQIEEKYERRRSENKSDLPAYRIVISTGDSTESDKRDSKKDIESLLRIHSESFENWRYLFEFDEGGSNNEFDFKAMDNFYNSLKDVLAELLRNRPRRFTMNKV